MQLFESVVANRFSIKNLIMNTTATSLKCFASNPIKVYYIMFVPLFIWLQDYFIWIVSIDEAIQKCECFSTCNDIKFGKQEVNVLHWLHKNTFRLELIKPKMRFKREVLYTITDIIGKFASNKIWSLNSFHWLWKYFQFQYQSEQ